MRWFLRCVLLVGLLAGCAHLGQGSGVSWVTVQVRNLSWRPLVVYVTNPQARRIGEVGPLQRKNLRVRRSAVEEREVGFILHPLGGKSELIPSIRIPRGIMSIRLRAEPPERSSAYYSFR